MKADQIYHALIELADKFKITVSEQNLQKTIVKAKSGFCIVKDQKRFIMDKHLSIPKKIDVLAAFLSTLPHEDLYIVPALREVLYKYGLDNRST
jgi:Sec7-like guanine-nucleotide exchange factor